MAKAFSERPRWQRWLIISCWGVLGLAGLTAVFGPEPKRPPAAQAAPADVKVFRAAFDALGVPCDAAQAAVGSGLQTMKGGDRVALARAVTRMESACGAAWLGVNDLAEPEGLNDAQEAALGTLRKECKMAFYARKQIAEQLMPVIDGDMRPSTMATLQDEMAGMQADVMRCALAVNKFDPPAPSPSGSPK